MHVNVYEHEVNLDVKLVTKEQRDAQGRFVRHMYGLRFAIGPFAEFDDTAGPVPRAAVTFWSSERHLAGDFSNKLAELQSQLDGD